MPYPLRGLILSLLTPDYANVKSCNLRPLTNCKILAKSYYLQLIMLV